MSKKGKRVARPDVRVSRDSVSGELTALTLDDVQRALERVVACIDRERLALSNAECYRLVDMVRERLETMSPHSEMPEAAA